MVLQRTATRCNTLEHTATVLLPTVDNDFSYSAHGSWTHCNKLQQTAIYCNTLQLFSRLQSTMTSTTVLTVVQRTATHCKTLQHTAFFLLRLTFSAVADIMAAQGQGPCTGSLRQRLPDFDWEWFVDLSWHVCSNIPTLLSSLALLTDGYDQTRL